MRLRRWCVSMTFEPMRFFWTASGADKFYWARSNTETRELNLIGVYRWNGCEWIKQAYTLVNGGMEKVWRDAPSSAKAN